MKTIIILLLFLTFAFLSVDAQTHWEGGLRIGDEISVDLTIPIAAEPRLHTAVYLDRFGVGGYFNWMFVLAGGPEGLKFYPGFGPEVWFGDGFDLDVAGDFGIEYSFEFPITIGFDWRPGFRITDSFAWKSSNWGFIARFRFGELLRFEKAN